MPSTDNRIVGLQFDNDKFESNVQQTLKSLEELKKGLEFKDSGEGLDDVQKKIDSMNLEKMANAIEQVSERFSTMGIIGMQVLTRLADAAIDTGKKMADALVFKPIRDGFQEHEQLADITKVLLYTGKGSIEEIQATMAQLNKFADDTIYKFGHMTSNLPRFTNQNISLQDSADALKGVALFAALAGASTENYASSADALSRSLGKGVVQQREWMRIRAAHMDTSDFKQLALDFAALNGVIEEGTYTLETFEDFIKDGKFTSKVLMDTLLHISDATTEIGQRAWKAATEVHKFTMLVDVLGEALQTGWADTLGIIIGNYDEATQLWTGIKNFFEEIIETATAARNAIFQEWKDLGGRDSVVSSFFGTLVLIKGVISAIGEAWQNVFGKIITGERLAKFSFFLEGLTLAMMRWLYGPLEDGRTRLEKFTTTLELVFGVVKFFIDIVRIAWYVLTAFVNALDIGGAISAVWTWLSGLGTEFLEFITNAERLEKVAESFEKLKDKAIELGKGISDFFSGIWDSLQYIFNPIVSKDLEGNTIRLLDTLQGHLGDPTILGLYIDGVKKRLKEKITELGADIKKWLLGAWEDIVAGAMVIGDAFSLLWDAIFHPERAVDKNIKAKEGDMFPGKEDPLSRYRNFITNFGTSLRELGIAIGDKIAAFVEDIPRMLSVLGSALSLLWKAIFNPASAIDYNIKAKENDIFGGKEDPLSRSRLFITKLGFSLRSLGIMVGDKVVEFVSNLPKIASDVFTAITDYLFPTKGKRLPDGRLAYEKASVGAAGGYAKLIEDDKLINRMGRKFAEWGRIVADFGVSLLSKLPGILESIGNFFGPIWESIKNWLSEHIPQPIKDAYHTVMGFLDPIIAPFKAFGTKLWEKIKHIFEVPGGKTDTSKTFLQRLKEQFATPEGVHAYLDSVWAKIKVEFEKIKKWFLEKTEGIRTFLSDLFVPKLKEGIDEAAEDMAQEGVEEAADGFFGTIGNILKSVWGWLTKISNQFNLASIASFGGLIALVGTVGKLFLNVSSAAKNMAQSAKFKNQKFYHTFAGQVAIIVGAVIALYFVIERAGQLDAGTFTAGVWRIAGILAVVVVLAYFMNRSNKQIMAEGKGSGIGSNLGISLLAMVGSVILVAVAIRMFAKIIQDIKDGNLNGWVVGGALAVITIILIGLMGLMKVFSGTKFEGKMDWKPIVAIAAALIAIAWAFAPLGKLKATTLLKAGLALLVVAGVLGALMAVTKIQTKGLSGQSDWKSIVAITVAIVAIGLVLLELAVIPKGMLEKAEEALLYIAGAIAGIILLNKVNVSGKMDGGNWKTVMASAAAIWIVAQAILPFATLSDAELNNVHLILLELGLILIVMGNISYPEATKGSVVSQLISALEAVALLFVIAYAIRMIRDVPTETVRAFVDGVSRILVALAAERFAGNAKKHSWPDIWNRLFGYGGAIGIIIALAEELKTFDGKNINIPLIREFTDGVSKIIGSLALMTGASGLAAINAKGAAGVMMSVVGLGGVAALLVSDPKVKKWLYDQAGRLGEIAGKFEGEMKAETFNTINDALKGIEVATINQEKANKIIKFLDDFNSFLQRVNTTSKSIFFDEKGEQESTGGRFIGSWSTPSEVLFEALGNFGTSLGDLTDALPNSFDSEAFETNAKSALDFIDTLKTWIDKFDDPENNIKFNESNEFYRLWDPHAKGKPSDHIFEAMENLGTALLDITNAMSIAGTPELFTQNQEVIFGFLDKLLLFMIDTKDKADTIDGFTGTWDLFWGSKEETGIQKILHGMRQMALDIDLFAGSVQGLAGTDSTFEADSNIALRVLGSVRDIIIGYSGLKLVDIRLVGQGIEQIGKLGTQVKNFMRIIDTEGEVNANRFITFAEGLSELFRSIGSLENIFSVSAATGVPIDQAFETLFSNAVAEAIDMSGITSTLQQTGVDLVNHITAGIEAPKMAIPKAFQFILDYITTDDILPHTKNIITTLEELGVALVDFLAGGIEGAADRLVNALKSVLSKMTEMANHRQYFNAMFASGRWYGLGLADGLWSTFGSVSNAASALAGVIADATNRSLDISSPSGKGIEAGQRFGDGLGVGMKKRYKNVEKVSTGMGTAILEAVNERLGIHSPSWEGINQAAMYVKGWTTGIIQNTRGSKSIVGKTMNWFGTQIFKGANKVIEMDLNNPKSAVRTTIDGFVGRVSAGASAYLKTKEHERLWDLYNLPQVQDIAQRLSIPWEEFIVNKGIQEWFGMLYGPNSTLDTMRDALDEYDSLRGGGGGGGGGRGGGGGGGSYGAASQVAIDDMSRKDMMLNLEQQFDKIAHKLDSLQIVLDDGTLVGRIMPTIDQRLGEAIQLEARG